MTRDEVKRKLKVLQNPDTGKVVLDLMKWHDVHVHGTLEGSDEQYAEMVTKMLEAVKGQYQALLAPAMQHIKKVKQLDIDG